MRTSTLLARNLTWYWRTNLAVLLGVATATGVLAGALLVGDSVRASLRDLVLSRLGNADSVVTRDGFFREAAGGGVGPACPMIAIDGVAAHEPSGRRAVACRCTESTSASGNFRVKPGEPPRGREILLSAALAQELGEQGRRHDSAARPEAFGDSAGIAARPQGRRGQDHPADDERRGAARVLAAAAAGRCARGVRAAGAAAARISARRTRSIRSWWDTAGPRSNL